jgi:HPt (histidine-containing phosphotransfer) domain-containing protein
MTKQRDYSAKVILDFPDLLSRVDNDRPLLRELIEIFKAEFPEVLNQFRRFAARQEMKSAENTCHTLKGMLSGLSGLRAAAVATDLERMCRNADSLELSASVELLESEVKRLLSELNIFVTEVHP